MKQIFKNLFYWMLDYLYLARAGISGVLRQNDPGKYRTSGGVPIILIPGVYENWHFMQPVARLLHANGYDVHVVIGLGYSRGTIKDIAYAVNEYIVEKRLSNLIIVAHSKGGLVGKYLLASQRDEATIKGLIALHSPFTGSRYAYILPLRSLRIFIPNSKVLSALGVNKIVNARIVSIYGKFDPHIPGGSKLAGAKNIQLNTYGHFRIMNSPLVHAAILRGIRHLL